MAGHIRKRGKRADGTIKWQARYPDPTDPTGQRRIEKGGFNSRKAAEDWLTNQQASVLHGEHRDPRQAQRTFVEAVEAWRETRKPLLAPNTQERYEDILRLRLMPEFGHLPLTAMTREVLKRYFARLGREGKTGGKKERAGKPLANGTVRKIHCVLSAVLSEAVEMDMIRAHLAQRMRLPASPRRKMTILTQQEVRALADATVAHYKTAVLLDANTGMRASELWALRRMDVDLLRGVLHIRQAVKRDTARPDAPQLTIDAYGREVGPPKNGRPRTIAIGKATCNMLAQHLTRPVPGGNGPETLVFLTETGCAVRHGVFMREVFADAVKELPADKRKLRFHDLRHTCASLLVAQGSPMLYVKERLGHSSITTTINLYGHMFPSVEASLADALDGMYAEGAGVDEDNVTPLRPDAAEG
jgi:integrase